MLRPAIFTIFFTCLFLLGPACNQNPTKPTKGPVSDPLTLAEPEQIKEVISHLLTFESNDRLRWEEARWKLRQLRRFLPADILDRLKETENTETGIARKARESLVRQGKIMFYLTRFDIPDQLEWAQARKNLVRLGDEAIESMVLTLSAKFSSPNRQRPWARRELRAAGAPTLPTIKSILTHDKVNAPIKKQLALTMVEMNEVARADIQTLLQSQNPTLPVLFLKIFENEKVQTWREPVEKLLSNNKNWQVRGQAALTLGTLQNEQSRPVLTKAVADPNLFVRDCAVQALGRLQDPNAIPFLIRELKTKKHPELTKNIIWSLNQLTLQKLKTRQEYLDWWQDSINQSPKKQ